MPLIDKAKRYTPRVKNQYVFMPTVAGVNALGKPEPTAAEISGGTWLTREVNAIDGFSTQTNWAETSDAATMFKGKMPASAEAADSSITFNGSEDGNDAGALFEQGQRGYLLLATAGVTEGAPAEVYEVIVGSVTRLKDLDQANLVRVDFGIPSDPNLQFSVPATVAIPSAA